MASSRCIVRRDAQASSQTGMGDSAMKSARLIRGAKDIFDPGVPHGITATHQDQVNAELLALLRSSSAPRLHDRMMADTSAAERSSP